MSIEDTVHMIVNDHFDRKNISIDMDLIDDVGADSLDSVEVIMAVEEQLDVVIPDEDVEKLRTIGDIIFYVKNAK
jgi:acyl carrier protein|tara:strand:+ start:3006 stop:3230 length:225 start_codon:yes stop_codon:yes gene_type:complete